MHQQKIRGEIIAQKAAKTQKEEVEQIDEAEIVKTATE